MSQISASVSVTLQVEVSVGVWNDTASFAELREQAIREATQTLEGILQRSGKCSIVGKPVSMQVRMRGEAK